MNAKLREVMRHREQLFHRAATQREELTLAIRDLKESMGLVRVVVSVIRTIKTHPAAAVGLAALLLGASQGKIAKLPKQLGLGWTILHLLQAWMSARQR